VWAVFLALARAFSRGPQLGLDIVVRKLPFTYQKILHGFGAMAMLIIALLVAWLGVELCLRQFTTGAVSNTALRFSLWMVTCALALGFLLLACHALVRVLGRVSENPDVVGGELK
jgi:TRAP-type C4-dicarboxylate transport system permease small subunit